MVPPWRSTTRRTTARPRPLPPGRAVTNGSNRRPATARGIPGPSSDDRDAAARRDLDRDRLRTDLGRVQHEVVEHLLELSAIAVDDDVRPGDVDGRILDREPCLGGDLARQPGELDALDDQGDVAGQAHELLGQPVEPIDLGEHVVITLDGRRGRQHLASELDVRAQDAERIADLVGDHRGHLADRGEPFCAAVSDPGPLERAQREHEAEREHACREHRQGDRGQIRRAQAGLGRVELRAGLEREDAAVRQREVRGLDARVRDRVAAAPTEKTPAAAFASRS